MNFLNASTNASFVFICLYVSCLFVISRRKLYSAPCHSKPHKGRPTGAPKGFQRSMHTQPRPRLPTRGTDLLPYLCIGVNPPWLKQKKEKVFSPLFALASTPFCANRAQPQRYPAAPHDPNTPTPRGRLCGLPTVERGGGGASRRSQVRGCAYVCARFLNFRF